ncbi:hypothetical protein F2Q69_00015333 [Brassica cretica]|uniref:Uncharacterized protein n=1 Tax=Brassica cretica TaxID=69181 RepID=A0A8S9QZP2_BRACR|nr:hypothetical protein F2Q69_00015333 [Brassica cretica]
MRGISSRSLYSLSRSLLSRVSHVATSGGCSRETRALGSLWSALQSRGVKVNAIQLRPGNVIERTGRTFRNQSINNKAEEEPPYRYAFGTPNDHISCESTSLGMQKLIMLS